MDHADGVECSEPPRRLPSQAFIDNLRKHVNLYQDRLGLCCVPLLYREKRPDLAKGQMREWVTERQDLHHIEAFIGGVAIVCGEPSVGLFVLDVDVDPEVFREKHPVLFSEHPIVRTNRGYHIWARSSTPVHTDKRDGVEILGESKEGVLPHLVTAPPSRHPSGHLYRFINEGKLSGIKEVGDGEKWLQDLLGAPVVSREGGADYPVLIPQGSRNVELTHLIGYLAKEIRLGGLGQKHLLALALDENERRCVPPLTEREVETIVRSIWGREIAGGRGFPTERAERPLGSP